MPKLYELLAALFIIASVNILSYLYQNQISNNDGKGMDGVEYYKIAEDILQNQKPTTRAPFVYRIGTPYLAGLISPDNLIFGFKLINITSGSLIPILLLFFVSNYFSGFIYRLLPVALFSVVWHSPLRLSWYYPVHSDPLAVFILLILIILLISLQKKHSIPKLIHFMLLTFTGVFFREICIIPAFVYAIKFIKFRKKNTLFNFGISINNSEYQSLLPLLFGITSIIILKLLTTNSSSYSFIAVAYSWIYRKSIFLLIHSLLNAYGPILFLILFKYKENIQFLKMNQEFAYILAIIILLAIAGGSDTERIFFWAFPVVFLLIINSLKNFDIKRQKLMLIIIGIFQIINMRVFWVIPDYPNDYKSILPVLTPLSDKFPLLDLWVWHADLKVNLVSFAGYVILFIILLLLYRYQRKLTNY